MGRDKRQAKGRLDKFYKLAKEQGYRARSAFKLIQLNKKYNFLYKSRVLVDLCAAPGGWLQVAQKYMPVSSVIVGVDLVPIKPIANVTTIVGDITTDKCRQDLRKELKTWKADVVLHDGSPNMGKAWLQDAYTQVELTLRALKLATEILMGGGIFITKVFRSKDYNPLLWVLNQLFSRVEVTKPSSSRNVSAEIYVSCFGFLAPKTIDPKLLDPKHVFGEIMEPPRALDILHPEKKRRSREGYEDGNYTLFKKAPISSLVEARDPVAILSTYNQLVFEGDELSERLATLVETTPDIRSFCEDLKVLGKSDFKQLLKWRTSVLKMVEKEKEAQSLADGLVTTDKETEEIDDAELVAEQEENVIDAELDGLQQKALRDERRQRRKNNERKAKLRERLRLKMVLPNDTGPQDADESLFALKSIRSRSGLVSVADINTDDIALQGNINDDSGAESNDDADTELDSGDDEILDPDEEKRRRLGRMEHDMEQMYEEYLSRKDPKGGRKRRRLSAKTHSTGLGEDSDDDDDDDDDDDGQSGSADANPLLVMDGETLSQKTRTEQWFSQPLFASLMNPGASAPSRNTLKSGVEAFDEEEDDEDVIRLMMDEAHKKTGTKPKKAQKDESNSDDETGSESDSDSESASDGSEDDDGRDEGGFKETDDDDENLKSKREPKKLTRAQLALASILVNKGKEALMDEAFNRYAFNDMELPAWLADDEKKHFAPNLNNPITRAEADAIKQRARELDAMPIKKVIEARARNKKKMQRQMERLKKKADLIVDDNEISERQKALQVQQLFKKLKNKKDEITYVVARGSNKGKRTRPAGVQGRYKMVDARLLKDKRGQDKAAPRRSQSAAKKKNKKRAAAK